MADTTTIEVSRENWRRLNGRKEPGDSFDDALGRVLDLVEAEADPVSEGSDDVGTGQQDGTGGDEIGAECDKCGHSWGYGGSRDPGQWVTCPACKSSVKL